MTFDITGYLKTCLTTLALFLLCAATAGAAADDAERDKLEHAVRAAAQPGPADIALRDQGTLRLPAGHVWLPVPVAAELLRAMGNTPGEGLMGLVFPADDGADGWMAVVTFVNEGYIKDDEARDWKADTLLQSLRDGTEAANEERARRGIPAIEVTGWAEPPKYDDAAHRLVWSALTRHKDAGADGGQGVNYNTYALGRDGYISLNLVTRAAALDAHKPEALKLLAALQYGEGKRYADFDASTDKVAAYGLAALVGGVAAKKLGLLALALAFAAKFAKVLLAGGALVFWGAVKLFKRNKAEPEKTRSEKTDLENGG